MQTIPALKPFTDHELQILRFQKFLFCISFANKQLSETLQHLSQNYNFNADTISELIYL
jgi:hypothetical protein